MIECTDLSGGNRRTLVAQLPHPFGLTVAGDHLYWTDWHTQSVHQANKMTGQGATVVADNLHGLMDIHAVTTEGGAKGKSEILWQ